MPARRLTVIPSVRVWVDGDEPALDRKFLDGLLHYVELRPGTVACVVRRATGVTIPRTLRLRADEVVQ